MDFFLGSGTTVAVAHKLGRKWLGVEMGEHFYTVVLPRMKRVLFYDKSGISKEKDVRERYNEQSAGGFFKYYELEQFEDALRRTRYAEDDLFTPTCKRRPLPVPLPARPENAGSAGGEPGTGHGAGGLEQAVREHRPARKRFRISQASGFGASTQTRTTGACLSRSSSLTASG
jgi:hypothetical protein